MRQHDPNAASSTWAMLYPVCRSLSACVPTANATIFLSEARNCAAFTSASHCRRVTTTRSKNEVRTGSEAYSAATGSSSGSNASVGLSAFSDGAAGADKLSRRKSTIRSAGEPVPELGSESLCSGSQLPIGNTVIEITMGTHKRCDPAFTAAESTPLLLGCAWRGRCQATSSGLSFCI